ncbi:distal tail protein Dit [Priestia megaterium]
MANFLGIYLNDIKMPDFVKVVGIQHSVLPSISQNTMSVAGRAGEYDYGNVIGTREITVDIQIVAPEENVLPQLLEQLGAWLYYEDAQKLVLGDNPNKYYMAKFTGDSNIKESFVVGEGSLTFLCTDPYIYGLSRTNVIPSTYAGEVLEVNNTGNAETFPSMKFEITKDITNFTVVSDEEYVDLGTPYDINIESPVNTSPYVMKDQLTTTNGWTTAPSVEGGAVTGSFEVWNSHCFRQASQDYGTGSQWHGAAMLKSLTTSVSNYEMTFYFHIDSNVAKVGRVQVCLLDANNVMKGRFQIKDASIGSSRLQFEGWIYGSGKSKQYASFTLPASIMKLTGYMRIVKSGRYYTAELYQEVGTRKYKYLYGTRFFDSKQDYQDKVYKAQLHVGVSGSASPAYLECHDLYIISKDVTKNDNQVPLILQSGDVLEIDNAKGAILKNGQPFYQYLNPTSTFIKLERGINGVIVSPADAFKNGEISFTERSL